MSSNVNYGLCLIMMHQSIFVNCNKCIALMGNVDHRKGYACVRTRNIQESLPSVQFCCYPKTVLKNSLLKIKKEKKEGKKEGEKEEKESRNLVISPWAKSPYFRSKDDHSNRNKNNILTILMMRISSIYSELAVHQVLVTTFFMG